MDSTTFLDLVKSFSGAIVGAFAAYAAVRERMGELIARVTANELNILSVKTDGVDSLNLVRNEANLAHARIDAHIEKFHTK